MSMILLRAGALSCALLATTCLITPAFGQDAPPLNHNVDANGVDVVLGTFNMTQRLLSIGPDGSNGLEYVRMLNAGQWLSNMRGAIHQSGSDILVSIGNTSAKFTSPTGLNLLGATSYPTARADGATLTRSGGTFTFTNAAGVTAHFAAQINVLGRLVDNTSRLADIRQPNGQTATLNYRTDNLCDEGGQACTSYWRLQSVTNSANYQFHFTYSQNTLASDDDSEAWHNLVSVQAINTAIEACSPTADSCTLTGSWPVVSFGTSGSNETVTLPDGGVWTFGPITGGMAIRRPGSTSDDLSITYDSLDRVQSITGAAGTWNYSYSDSGATRTTSVSGPLSASRIVTSDLTHQVVTADENALSFTTSYQYDSYGRLTRTTLPEGNYTQLTYDGRGNVTEIRIRDKGNVSANDIVTTASFDSTCSNALTCNQPNSTTDANGNTTDYAYSSTHGGLLTVTAPAPTTSAVRPQTRISYSQVTAVSGQPVYLPTGFSACQTTSSCTSGSDEVVSSVSYNTSNLLPTSVTRGNGSGTLTATSAITYDDIGNPLNVDGPLTGSSDTTRIRYNSLRQVVGVIGPDPDGGGSLKHRAVRTTYDAADLPIAVETGTVNSQSDSDWTSMAVLEGASTERDGFGRPVVQRLVSGSTTYSLAQTSYDARGRVQCVAQRMNISEFATSALPSDACTLDTQGSYGPDRIVMSLYDEEGQLLRTRTAVGTGLERDVVIRGYTANGQVGYVIDGEDNLTDYVHDGHDRLEYTYFPSATRGALTGSMTDYEKFAYNPAGNVVSRRLRDGTSIAYTYDNLNRATLTNLPGSELDVTYTYDLLNRMTSAYTSAQTLTFVFDALGRNTSQTGPHGTVGYAYDVVGRRTQMTYADSGLYVNYDYNVAGDLTAIRENGATSGIGVLATYTYDDQGRRMLLHRGNGTETTYGRGYASGLRTGSIAQNLLSSGSDITFDMTYNPAGQIVTRAGAHGGYAWQNHYAVNRSYAANGLNQYTAIGSITPTYDASGNTTSAGGTTYGYNSENMLTSASGGVTLSYDPFLRLYETVGGGVTTRMAYDGNQLIAEYNSSNALQRRYVYGPGTDELLVWYQGTGTSDRRWYHADERGSIITLSDNSGNNIGYNAYDEYGFPGAWNTGRFQYTGQQWIAELGMYHYRARIYSPGMGRFLQSDPIGYSGGMNLYAYVHNDPVNFTDPLGLQDLDMKVDHPAPCPNGCTTDFSNDLGRVGRTMVGRALIGDPPPADENQLILVSGRRAPRIPPGSPILPVLNTESVFAHYLTGRGQPICLTTRQFANLRSFARREGRRMPNGDGTYNQRVSFYNTSYELTFGRSTMTFDANDFATGFYDLINYNSANRGGFAEGITRFGNAFGNVSGGTSYEIGYPC